MKMCWYIRIIHPHIIFSLVRADMSAKDLEGKSVAEVASPEAVEWIMQKFSEYEAYGEYVWE